MQFRLTETNQRHHVLPVRAFKLTQTGNLHNPKDRTIRFRPGIWILKHELPYEPTRLSRMNLNQLIRQSTVYHGPLPWSRLPVRAQAVEILSLCGSSLQTFVFDKSCKFGRLCQQLPPAVGSRPLSPPGGALGFSHRCL